jgi:hypothetical protein
MAQAETITGWQRIWAFGGSSSTSGAISFAQKVRQGWSDAGADRQGANHMPFRRQHAVQPSYGLLNWNGC